MVQERLVFAQGVMRRFGPKNRQGDGSECSIFAFDVVSGRSRAALARNAVRKMRILRHPGVVKVFDTVEVCAGSAYWRPLAAH